MTSVEFIRRGRVHDIQVVRRGRIRSLRFGRRGGWQGAIDLSHPHRPVFPYQRAFYTLVSALPAPQRYLSVGVGTGTSLRSVRDHWPDCELTGVELDEAVLDTAIEFFGSPSHHETQYFIGDGVEFLKVYETLFDLIFVDAYLSDRIYSPCLEPEFARLLAQRCSPNGVVACNLISRLPPMGAVFRFLSALEETFDEVWILPVGIPLTEQNCLVVACRQAGSVSGWRRALRRDATLAWYERLIWPHRLFRYQRNRVL
jgi:spermidine synthase